MAWLAGWLRRVKLTIDQGDISVALANFPVLLHLGTSVGRGPDDISFVFDELEGDANRKKIAVTTSNGTTECYVEVEKWDHANEQAWLWVKVPNIASDADTELYLYYDKLHADNTAYVGDPSDAVVHNVWDGSFKMVQHMHGASAGACIGSTVNANDVTAANGTPAYLQAGKIGDAVDVELASSEYLTVPDAASLDLSGDFTLEAWVRIDALLGGWHVVIGKEHWNNSTGYVLYVHESAGEQFLAGASNSNNFEPKVTALALDTWYYLVVRLTSGLMWLFLNGVSEGSSSGHTVTANAQDLLIGSRHLNTGAPGNNYFDGVIDEVRISSTSRTNSWLVASYESGRDHLLDWGAEELAITPITGTAAFEVEPVALAGEGTFTFQWHGTAIFEAQSVELAGTGTFIALVIGTAAFEVEPVTLAGTGTFEKQIVHAFAGMEITIESPYGTKLGAGPIVTALNWRNSPSLDGAGAFSFDMPVAGPRASLLAKKRYARCYGLLGGVWTELGKAGIIDRVETIVEPGQEPRFAVSGKDLMRELTFRTVGDLELVEVDAAWSSPGWVRHEAGARPQIYGESRDMPEAFDDDVGTDHHVILHYDYDLPSWINFIYVGYPYKTAGLKFTLGNVNGVSSTANVQYFNGSAWVGVAAFVDGTKPAAATLAQNGEMTFTKPADHEKTTHNGVEAYWLRLSAWYYQENKTLDEVEFIEIDVLAEGPTTEGLADIMAFAPAGWSVDTVNGYAATGEGAYVRFTGQNVLEALVILAGLTGEHFRLGVGRKVVWIRDDPVDNPTQCGYRALPAYGASVGDNLLVCQIQSMVKIEDSFEEHNRIYPHGAGTYPDRIDLTHATADVPDGYTLVTANNYVQHDASATVLLLEHDIVFPEAGLLTVVSNELTANQLLARTMEYLKRHKDVHESYEIVVVGLAGLVNPGDVIPVQYWEYVGGVLVLDVDKTLIILEPTIEVTEEGLFTVALTVSTTDMWPRNDARKLVRFWQITARGLAG